MSYPMSTPDQLRSGNPALSEKFIDTQLVPSATTVRTMSVAGVSVKTLILLGFVVAGGAWGWASATEEVPASLGSGFADTTVTIPGGFWLASFGAFLLGIFIAVAPGRAAPLGILYALAQGFCLGAISAAFDAQTDGIVSAAVLSTVCVFAVAWLLFVTRIVRPTQKLAFAVIAALGGLGLLYFFVFIMSIFDWGWLYSESFRTVGLIVTVISVVLAALSLVLDFGTVEAGVEAGAPKGLEWYLAFSLMVTLIWLYMTLLRLLALLSRSRQG
ncbi:MAG: Bax inhibitor-1/YccA family protein [Acidimicrobiia bacterium]|nr:Bax inhibitor-1/YccA family protein [Acidimicrobiia bacterium]